jgi:LuxR family maltose regulon positive regulatory protein
VSRPRLIARLDQGAERKLTLVCAPAGFGKTTLLAEWLARFTASERRAAWVSLDPGDNDPARFWAYVVAALQTIRPGIGANALSLVQSPQPPPIESVLATLINELAALEDDVALVLDDLHVIDAQPIQAAIAFLLEHLPPTTRLVIATREDPPLSLARLRARDQLSELRAADLRFSASEAAEFLNEVMGLNLSAADVAALEERTEGWIAGLQLAALSMRGREDIPGFVRAFAGTHRYIVDYLVDEVLQRQPAPVRRFLLQTAILDRLHGPLCDAVTGQEDGIARLEALERGNFLVVPLDDTRHWYRYHHLFADVLRAHLLAEQPDLVPTLHRRASAWYEHHGSASDAIRHALAAKDFARAADLVELASPAMRRTREEATLLGWLRALPDEVLRCRPVLSNLYAGVLLQCGELETVDARLQDAERWLETTDGGEFPGAATTQMVVVDEGEFRHLPGMIAVHRAGHALARGDVVATVHHARRALNLIAEDDHLGRGAAAALQGLASWTSGDLEAAYRSYADGMESLRKAGYIADTIGGVIALADIRIAQGRIREAMDAYERALRLATEQGPPVMRGTADMHVGLAELHRERNDLDAARQHLLRSKELGESAGFPQYPYRWRVAMARIREAEGDPDGALELLDEAERRYVSDFYPNVRPIAALKARIWVVQGRLDDALGWARQQRLSAEDDLSYLREFEHVTLARVLLAHAKSDRDDRSIRQAIGLLERLLEAAQAGERTGSVIEILVVQALALAAQGDVPRALVPLERALTLAEPEGYVRLFVDEGEAMRTLLRHAAAGGTATATAYAHRLLSSFDMPTQPTSRPARAAADALAEPLTAREVEVLRLIGAGLRNQEIADRLFVSLPTVKRHIANAYGKLGVTHRTEAIARANELKVL